MTTAEVPKNSILQRLPDIERSEALAYAEFVHYDAEDVMVERNQPITVVTFPEAGLFSMLAVVEGEQVEVATIGSEGFVGIPIVLGEDSSSGRTFCQIPASGYQIDARKFRERVLPRCPELFRLCCRFASFTFDQAAQNSVCNRMHSIDERCAKWLLLSHDRSASNRFELTQKFLAQMLGVRRQSVNLSAAALQHAGLIRYSRGHIEVLQREELEQVACECYAVIKQALSRFLNK